SAWERCNTLIMSWLLNSLSPSIAQSVIFLEYDTDIWNDLRECFSQGDLLRIAELQEEIYGLSQGRSVSSSLSTNKNASNKKCSYCHRTGHTINVCWGKHDYPSGHPHYLGRPRFNNRDSSSSANSTASVDPVERPTASSCPITLTQAQYQSLMALIQQPNSASNATGNNLVQPNSANLIQVPFNKKNGSDFSGATDHIASSLKCFSSYSKINPIQINFPNKSIVTAYISRTIIFSPNFILHDVLFV
ncbi:hypothetical protein glysoja_032189, partial [Glycine soja]